ncbi:MAG: glycogen synthase [Lewinellaceae bacterium]|nr:glycogen synthase [Lewinellaceae bacterium]
MIQVLHVAAECYPAAKTGGLGDVVGSLPKYLTQAGYLSAAIIPKYALKWIHQQQWDVVHGGAVRADWRHHGYTVQQERSNKLGFPLFVVDVPGLFDRPGIYADPQSGQPYGDEVERYLVFQQAVLQWLRAFPEALRPRTIHCHDHHTGLIPFMVKHCPEYRALSNIPTAFTIHNGQYQGWFGWNNEHLVPYYDANARGILDWNGYINPMAAAVKAAWAVTTVSPSYLYELHQSSLGLESLFRSEWYKEHGIINGIDADVWDPRTDAALQYRLEGDDIAAFKAKNKRVLCEWFGLSEDAPLVSFIGRMVSEKGVDILPDTYRRILHEGGKVNFLVLGTGETWTENQFRNMAQRFQGRLNAVIDYNEALAHQIYAGSDFLIMPSRVEPCGLNQMYAMRYGAIPIVRGVGGLKDTVPDIAEQDGSGRGIRFDHFSVEEAYKALHRATSMWHNNPDIVAWLRKKIMAIDFSWEKTIDTYLQVYRNVGAVLEPGLTVSLPVQKTEKPKPAPKVKTAAAPKAKASAAKSAPEAKTASVEPEKPAATTPAKSVGTPKAKASAAKSAPKAEPALVEPKKQATLVKAKSVGAAQSKAAAKKDDPKVSAAKPVTPPAVKTGVEAPEVAKKQEKNTAKPTKMALKKDKPNKR